MNDDKNNDRAKILVLDGAFSRILSFSTDGKTIETLLNDCGGTPDGIAVDERRRHIYWTNMGGHFDQNDGFIERVDFDGKNRTVIVPPGATFTPKQLKLDLKNNLIYWCDREGMRVMRAAIDGSDIVTLVQTGSGKDDRKDERRHCVGIALDIQGGFFYWTQKGPPKGGVGKICRAGINYTATTDPAKRDDIETLWEGLPEPIDLDINESSGELYWTDRGALPKGNTLNRASVVIRPLPDPEILATGLQEAIGLCLDIANERAFFVDLGGNLYSSDLNGIGKQLLYTGKGRFTGIAYVHGGLL